jgi:hypothetical protein
MKVCYSGICNGVMLKICGLFQVSYNNHNNNNNTEILQYSLLFACSSLQQTLTLQTWTLFRQTTDVTTLSDRFS